MDDRHKSSSSSRRRDEGRRDDRDRGRDRSDRDRDDSRDKKRRREDDDRRDRKDAPSSSSEPSAASQGGANAELSAAADIAATIREANKLRAELGMPLLEEVNEADLAASREAAASAVEQAQPELTPEEAAAAAAREQKTLEVMANIEKAKKKRMQTQVLGKSLGEELAEEDEGLLAWVMKHKAGQTAASTGAGEGTKGKERDLAKRTARMLDDADRLLEEQGADDEHSRVRQRTQKKGRRSAKNDVAVPSIIAHRPDELQEGEIVMVLKDAPVLAGSEGLNEEEDELENINILEMEKAKEFQERKKKKPIYDVYGDINSDKKSILAQYDEKPDRVKFRLDAEGRVEEDVDTKLDRVREKLNANRKILYDVSGPTSTIASEFLKPEEITTFKAPRSKKEKKARTKKLRKKTTTAELIEAMESATNDDEEHHGSRREKSAKQIKDETERSAEVLRRKEGWSKAVERAREESRSIYGSRGIKDEPDEDGAAGEEEEDLYSAVSKARKAAINKQSKESMLAAIAESRKRKEDRLSAGDGGLVLSDTTEFCASLSTEGLALKAKKKKRKTEAEPEPEPMEEASVEVKEEEEEEDLELKSGFRPVEPGSSAPVAKRIAKEEEVKMEPALQSVVPEEPLVAKGLAATLQLLNQQGGGKALELDSYGGRARDKVLEIPDSDDPAPNIRLDKIDEFGRKMTPREAFRHLSHKFHGKMPGKKKTEKKIQKYEEELKRKKMSSLDTPLSSLQAMQKAQEITKTPYLVLSSSSAASRGLDLSKNK